MSRGRSILYLQNLTNVIYKTLRGSTFPKFPVWLLNQLICNIYFPSGLKPLPDTALDSTPIQISCTCILCFLCLILSSNSPKIWNLAPPKREISHNLMRLFAVNLISAHVSHTSHWKTLCVRCFLGIVAFWFLGLFLRSVHVTATNANEWYDCQRTNSAEIRSYLAGYLNADESVVSGLMTFTLSGTSLELNATCSKDTEGKRTVTMDVRSSSVYRLHLYVSTF